MFCSKCGMTIPEKEAQCKHCGAKIAPGYFSAASYIGSQPIDAGEHSEGTAEQMPRYTKISYTTIENSNEDVVRATAYRPVFKEEPGQTAEPEENTQEEAPAEPVPQENKTDDGMPEANTVVVKREKQEAPENPYVPTQVEKPEEPAVDLPEGDLPEIFRFHVAEELKPAGISQKTQERMRMAESQEAESGEKKPEKPVVSSLLSKFGRNDNINVPKREEVPQADDADDDEDFGSRKRRFSFFSRKQKGDFEDDADTAVDKPADEPAKEADQSDEKAETKKVASTIVKRQPVNEDNDGEEDYDDAPSVLDRVKGLFHRGGDEADDGEGTEEQEVFDNGDNEDEDDDTPRKPLPKLFSMSAKTQVQLSNSAKIVRIAIVAVVIVALLIGGFVFISMKIAGLSPVTGVTHTLYEKGLALLQSHTTDNYKNELLALYREDPTGASMLQRQSEDQAAFTALLPGTPQSNDQAFVDACLVIQTNIDNAVALDGLYNLTGVGDEASSAQRWEAVRTAINELKDNTEAGAFEAIAAGSTVAETPTPAPEATKSPYTTLTKGMHDNDAVKAMQQRLYDLGWLNDARDGDFGPATQEAVKAFQQACGLSVTGIADPETLAMIYSDDAPRTGIKVTAAPTEAAE